jgi:hypothetical protein
LRCMSPRSGLKQSHESEEFVLGFLYLTLYIYSGRLAETGGRCRDALGWRIVRGHCQHKHFLEAIN